MKKIVFSAIAAALFCTACEKDDPIVPVESVTLNETTLTITEGETAQLTATVVPDNADNAAIVWSSDDEEIATVSESGLVTAIAVGTATIKATAGGQFAECTVTVTALTFKEYEGYFVYYGETYNIVTLKDGNTWMAENLRYVPEGKTVSPVDFSANTGIFYPCETVYDAAAGTVTVTAKTDEATIKSNGYFYTHAVALGVDEINADNYLNLEGVQGICPDGWHIPSTSDWIGLVGQHVNTAYINTSAPYYDETVKGAPLKDLNDDGFNIYPFQYVNAGTKYGNVVLNKTEGQYLYGQPSMGYFAGSTGYTTTTGGQQMQAVIAYNLAAKQYAGVAYCNISFGVNVRCVKNK